MSEPAASGGPAAPRRGPGRPRLLEPSAEYLAKQDSIVAAAAAVFHEKGYDGGSLDDVAEMLDITKASMYHYVKSKRQLLYLIFKRALCNGIERARELSKIADPGERLAALIRFQVEIVAEDTSHFAVFFDNLLPGREHTRVRGTGELAVQVRSLEREYFEIFVNAVEGATDAGVIGPVDPRYGAHTVIGMASWVYKWFDPSHDDVEQAVQTCINLVALQPSAASIGKAEQ